MVVQQGELFRFGRRLVHALDRNVVKWDVVEVGPPLRIRVVTDDDRDLARDLTALVTVQKVSETVVVLRDEQGDPVREGREFEPPAHAELVGERRELAGELGRVEVEVGPVPFDSGQEQAAFGVLVLVVVEDVGVVAVQELADGGDQALSVGAVDQQDGSICNGEVGAGGSVVLGRSRALENESARPTSGGRAGKDRLVQAG